MMSEADEIAELEAKLARLKAEKELTELQDDEELPPMQGVEAPKGFDITTMSARNKVAVTQGELTPSELLSEAWKEDTGNNDNGSLLAGLGTAVVALLAFVAISFVPLGNDVQIGMNDEVQRGLPSAAEIRARYEAAGSLDEDE